MYRHVLCTRLQWTLPHMLHTTRLLTGCSQRALSTSCHWRMGHILASWRTTRAATVSVCADHTQQHNFPNGQSCCCSLLPSLPLPRSHLTRGGHRSLSLRPKASTRPREAAGEGGCPHAHLLSPLRPPQDSCRPCRSYRPLESGRERAMQ